MRSYQVFAAMPPERATAVLQALSRDAPGAFAEALQAAAIAMKARPVYLRRQPPEKQAAAMRRALSRVGANGVADEILAVFFLRCRKDLLVEWLDAAGLEHDDGMLEADAPPQPAEETLTRAVKRFREREADPDRELLLHAFAAQDAIEWPALEAQLGALS